MPTSDGATDDPLTVTDEFSLSSFQQFFNGEEEHIILALFENVSQRVSVTIISHKLTLIDSQSLVNEPGAFVGEFSLTRPSFGIISNALFSSSRTVLQFLENGSMVLNFFK